MRINSRCVYVFSLVLALAILVSSAAAAENLISHDFGNEGFSIDVPSGSDFIKEASTNLNVGDVAMNMSVFENNAGSSDDVSAVAYIKDMSSNQNIVDEARQRAERLGLGDELLDSLYLLTDLQESEARARLEQVGLEPDILADLFPRFPETATREAVADIFESLDLDLDILQRKSYELSGGQKVRVMLALILVSKPEFLLLDEPFGDLDPVTLRTVTNSLKKISKKYKITIIMISHNTDFIKELSNRALFMDDGKIIDDSEDMDEIVNNFIDFCHASYLKENE